MNRDSRLYSNLDNYVRDSKAQFESHLGDLVEVPTVSMDPDRKPDINRGAELAAQYLQSVGASAELVETPGNPVVFGRLEADPNDPTITIYNHLDVQPADASEWHRAPFSFYKEDGRYEGRGTTDDKGPAITAMFAAAYARQNGLPLNINFIWELEEEIGSPNFEHFVANNVDRLKTDSVVVSDTIWISRKIPAIPYGLRGAMMLTMKLETGAKDVHSGLTGGPARNPIGELCKVISQCYDADTGRVRIKGFYDDVRPAKRKELKSFLDSGFTTKNFMRAHELKSLRFDQESDVLTAIMAMPTFELHGITGGYQGPGVKTIVPHQAEAKISCRLVPDQNAKRVFKLIRDFVKRHNPDVKVTFKSKLDPYIGDFSGPYTKAAAEAMRFAFGKDPAFTREGGSIGAVVTMKQHLDAPIAFLGLSLPEHGYHAINENFDWAMASGGIKMFVRYLDEVSRIPRR
ncbi:MAG TPA: M20/M25/M40 family metallo-hydrolase [Blastocatellia bacterium]|nr:M20/M25/M40 family metallo-hydrolase [Blastocatellia bacterium]